MLLAHAGRVSLAGVGGRNGCCVSDDITAAGQFLIGQTIGCELVEGGS